MWFLAIRRFSRWLSTFPKAAIASLTYREVGAAKLEQFSEEFLTVIRGYALENGLTERNIPPRGVERRRAVKLAGSTNDETEEASCCRNCPVSEIAERRGLTEHTIINHLERLVTAGENLDLDHLMPPAKRLVKDSGRLSKRLAV